MTGHDGVSAGPVRDFRGYGRYIPQVRWPDGVSLVVSIVLNYESGAEYSLQRAILSVGPAARSGGLA